ncbi:MAG: hypothetical protein LUC98_07190, partial [Lachnospiraceae bacterium]|nr:hypothetical protein [Lachnospiraceae bacterium]
ICRDNYENIEKLEAKSVNKNARSAMLVTNWGKARESLIQVSSINDFLSEKADTVINNVPAPFMNRDGFNVSQEEWNKINRAKTDVLNSLECIIDLYESMGIANESCAGIDVKIPKCDEFTEYVEYLKKLDFIFTKCPFLNIGEEKLKFQNVDVGSNWLTFVVTAVGAAVGGSYLLNNLAAFVDKAIIVRSHYLTMKAQERQLEREERNDNDRKIIMDFIKQTYKDSVDASIKDLESSTKYEVQNKDGDEYNRIQKSLEDMGEMVEKGLEIYSTIDSPREAKALFEPLEMKYLKAIETLALTDKEE